MMMDESLVYIDTPAVADRRSRNQELRDHAQRYADPRFLIRRNWSKQPPPSSKACTTMPSDGIVCMTSFRTLGLKEPTVDLRYANWSLCSVDSGQ